jgi:hypothetical protein
MRRASPIVFALLLFTSEARSDPQPPPEDWVPPDTVITMSRDGCERRCPVYSVVILSDGTVIMEGQYYLRRPIFAKSQIFAKDLRRLVDRFKELDFLHLPDIYGFKGKGCTSFGDYDAQGIFVTIVTEGQGKSIAHSRGCFGPVPDRLTALENEIDRLADSSRRIKEAQRGKRL